MTMLTVHLFAGIQALVGARSIEVDLPDGATVGVLRERLLEDYPILEPFMSTYAIAVGDEIAQDDEVISGGRRIELIPPIAGGSLQPSGGTDLQHVVDDDRLVALRPDGDDVARDPDERLDAADVILRSVRQRLTVRSVSSEPGNT